MGLSAMINSDTPQVATAYYHILISFSLKLCPLLSNLRRRTQYAVATETLAPSFAL